MKQLLAVMLVLAVAAPVAHADPAEKDATNEQDTWRAAFAGSVMVTATGAMLLLWGRNRIDTAEHALCTGSYASPSDCGHAPPATAAMVDDYNSKGSTGQTVARVGLGVLIAGVVLTGITGYKGFAGGTHESTVSVTPSVSPQGAGASLSLRF